MLRALLLSTLLLGCPANQSPPPVEATPVPVETPVTPPPTPEPPADPPKKADGEACLTAAECNSGVCEGQGCTDDLPGTCAPELRACTKDLVPYCGCDGVEFSTSGSCAGRRYVNRGSCAP
jgi:hypothetical protein